MRRPTTSLLTIAVLAASLLGASVAEARGGARAWRVQASAVSVSSDAAARIARSATGGRVLSVSLRNGKRPAYRVKVLIDGGRVRTVTVDARTGAVR